MPLPQLRMANFRDQVMYGLAYKMGLDPSNVFGIQADAYASFINTWIRKLFDRFDWPEWTVLNQFTPDANHYVPIFQTAPTLTIGRVLKLYLTNPITTRGVLDTPFKQNVNGIWCGFEHGPTVWMKYLPQAPLFTAKVWSSTTTYSNYFSQVDRSYCVTYDPISGWCFASAQDGNTNHNPFPVDATGTWWQALPFPESLVDLVVRGAYSEALREDGQTEKAIAEEQAVMSDAFIKAASQLGLAYDVLSDQARPAQRYRPPGGAADFMSGVLGVQPQPVQR
jgi:hypothetical protein